MDGMCINNAPLMIVLLNIYQIEVDKKKPVKRLALFIYR